MFGKADDLSDLSKVFNNNDYKLLREQMLTQESLEAIERCYKCVEDDKMGLIGGYKDSYYKDVDHKNPVILSLEIAFNNVCNYKCRGCASELSTSWAQDEKTLLKYPELDRKYTPPSFLPDFDMCDIDTLREVKFCGGEPLLYPKFKSALDTLPRNCRIIIFTNCSIAPDKELIDILSAFKIVEVNLSIDGYKELNSYIRSGSTWENTVDVAKKWIESKLWVRFSTLISAYSIPHFKKLFDWIGEINPTVSIKDSIIPCELKHPPYLRPSVLPQEVIDKAKTELKPYGIHLVNKVLATCKHVDDPRFKLFTEKLDELRGEDANEYNFGIRFHTNTLQ